MPTFELLYNRSHEWLGVLEDETAYIGISSYRIKKLRLIVGVSLPDVKDDVYCGRSFATIEKTDSISDLYSPVTGTVLEVNNDFMKELKSDDPWLIRIKLKKPVHTSNFLLPFYEYTEYIEECCHD